LVFQYHVYLRVLRRTPFFPCGNTMSHRMIKISYLISENISC
jgi:hypothetical protein